MLKQNSQDISWMERGNKTGFNIMIVHFYIRRKLDILRYDA